MSLLEKYNMEKKCPNRNGLKSLTGSAFTNLHKRTLSISGMSAIISAEMP